MGAPPQLSHAGLGHNQEMAVRERAPHPRQPEGVRGALTQPAEGAEQLGLAMADALAVVALAGVVVGVKVLNNGLILGGLFRADVRLNGLAASRPGC